MKKINIIAIATLAILATSCTSYSFTSRSIKIDKQDFTATSAFVDIVPDYSRRIIAESGKYKTPKEAMNEAKFNAIVENKIDVLVDPIYKVTKTGRKYMAQVVGFAGFYKNNRNFYEDLERLKKVDMKEIEKYLLLKDPSLLPLFKNEPRRDNSREGDVINIYHNSKQHAAERPADKPQQPKPQPQPQPQVQPQQPQPQAQPQAQPQTQQQQEQIETELQKPQNKTYNSQNKTRSRSNKSNRSGSKK